MSADGADASWELEVLRRSIDNLDAALVHILAERFRCTERIGAVKAAARLPAVDRQREDAHIADLRALAGRVGLDPALAERILRTIMDEVVDQHRALRRHEDGRG